MWKIVVSVLLFVSFANASFWSACDNFNGVAPDVIVSPSCSGTTCQASRGEKLVANVTFTPRNNHNELRVDVWATMLGVQMRLPREYPHDNACNNIFLNGVKVNCPIVGAWQHLWILEMDIPTNLPALNDAVIRYEIWDGIIPAVCAEIVADLR